MIKYIFSILTVLFFVSKINAQSIKNTRWLLLSIDNLKANEHKLIGSFWVASLHFNSDSSYGGNSGCNSYGGFFKTDLDNSLMMGHPVRTKIGCQSLGEELFHIYPNVNFWKIKIDTLFLFTDNYSDAFKKQKVFLK
jgi:hypothetical protein